MLRESGGARQSAFRPLLIGVVLLTVGARPVRADNCMAAKLKAIGNEESGLLACVANPRALPFIGCGWQLRPRFPIPFETASCVGDERRCEGIALACSFTVSTSLLPYWPLQGLPELSECRQLTLKAAGKLAKRELACYSKSAARGLPVDTVRCIPKARQRFATEISKAGTCPPDYADGVPDGGSPQDVVENHCVLPAITTDASGTVTDLCPSVACGTLLTTWGSQGSGDGQFNFAAPPSSGVAVDGNGNVYVSDDGHRVQKFDAGGRFLTSWGSIGSGDGQFFGIGSLAADTSGNVYVTDWARNRVQKFDSSGMFLTGWGSQGDGDGQFNLPNAVAVDPSNGDVYVGDCCRVQKFDSNGAFLGTFLSGGDGVHEAPTDIAVDGSENVYVANMSFGSISKFDSTGTLLTKLGFYGAGSASFFPSGIAVGGNGDVYVSDSSYNQVHKFDSQGRYLNGWGGSGHPTGWFIGAGRIAVGGDGSVYVADTANSVFGGNDRIETFTCPY